MVGQERQHAGVHRSELIDMQASRQPGSAQGHGAGCHVPATNADLGNSGPRHMGINQQPDVHAAAIFKSERLQQPPAHGKDPAQRLPDLAPATHTRPIFTSRCIPHRQQEKPWNPYDLNQTID